MIVADKWHVMDQTVKQTEVNGNTTLDVDTIEVKRVSNGWLTRSNNVEMRKGVKISSGSSNILYTPDREGKLEKFVEPCIEACKDLKPYGPDLEEFFKEAGTAVQP